METKEGERQPKRRKKGMGEEAVSAYIFFPSRLQTWNPAHVGRWHGSSSRVL